MNQKGIYNGLSGTDMLKAFDNKINLYSYDQLQYINSIDELLQPYGRAIILYFWNMSPKIGHYCCVFKNKNNNIEFFDPFGSIEQTLKQIPKQFKTLSGQDYPKLTELLYECPYEVEYNDKKIQSEKTSVCGRYCIVRMILNNLNINQFQKCFNKSPLENDKLIYEITNIL